MIKTFLFISFILCSSIAFSEEKVIYKFKEYERFDLGDLEIKGSIVAPGDITVKERRRQIFKRKLYHRYNFNKEIIFEIKTIR